MLRMEDRGKKTWMCTCAPGLEVALVHELLEKLNADIFGPFLPQGHKGLNLYDRTQARLARRRGEPCEDDFRLADSAEAIGFVRSCVAELGEYATLWARADCIAEKLTGEGIVLCYVHEDATFESITCTRGVYSYIGACNMPYTQDATELHRAFREFIGCDLDCDGVDTSAAMERALREWYAVHGVAADDTEVKTVGVSKRAKMEAAAITSSTGAVREGPKFVGNIRLTPQSAESFHSTVANAPLTAEQCRSTAVPNVHDASPVFRATLEKRTSKSYSVRGMDLAGSVGFAMQMRYGWPVNLERYNIEVFGIMTDFPRACYLGITLNDILRINQRHRVVYGHASMQAYVAAAMFRLARVPANSVVLDPMCGSATICVEGAFDRHDVVFLGCDVDVESIEVAQQNIQALAPEMAARLAVMSGDSTQISLQTACVNTIITDMPWGRRCGSAKLNKVLYPRAIQEWARVLVSGGSAFALTLEHKLMASCIAKNPYFELKRKIKIDVGHQVALYELTRNAVAFGKDAGP
eukprot:m.323518 g.323518  ORF g.323518 m.323518 type:complete len:525 (+) comp16006_c0_seq23:34-1608(+)